MTAASDPMRRVFNLMARVFHDCAFWMTVLSNCMMGDVRLVTGHVRCWNGQGKMILVYNISFFSCTRLSRFIIFSVCVLMPFHSSKQQHVIP